MAAATTTVLFGLAALHMQTGSVRTWLVIIAIPAVAVSLAATLQYRSGRHSGAGTAAMVLLWVFVLLFNVSAGWAFIPAAGLQTAAWVAGRPKP
jgi:hypothetical protein